MNNSPAFKSVILIALGIIAGHHIKPCLPILLISLVVLILILCILKGNRILPWVQSPLIIVSLIITGIIRIQSSAFIPVRHIMNLSIPGQPLTCTATLIQDPVYKSPHTQFIVRTDSLIGKTNCQTTGKLMVMVNGSIPPLYYGDRIRLQGTLALPSAKRNPGGFDYRAYLAIRNIHGILRPLKGFTPEITGKGGSWFLRYVIYPIRRRMKRTLQEPTSGHANAVLQALLLGDKTELDSTIREAFARAGIVHILAVSGLHTGFVCGFLILFFGCLRLPYTLQIFLTISGLVLFALLTEANPPVVRAVCMASLYLIGTLLQRRPSTFNILGITALLFLMVHPQQLFSPGFQFSYSAVFSILFFYPKLTLLRPVKFIMSKCISVTLITKLVQLILVSLAASLGTIPLTALYYNQIPTLFILTNLFAIPMAGLIVTLGFLTVVFSLIHPWIASVYGCLTQMIIFMLIKITMTFSHLPYSGLVFRTPSLFHISLYFSFISIILNIYNDKKRKLCILTSLCILNVFIWYTAIRADRRNLTWTQLDVGQGDAAVLQLPGNRTLLIDCGDRTPYFDNGKRVIAPYLRHMGISQLHAVFITHPHNDHIGGLPYLLEHFTIDHLYIIASEYHSALHTECNHLITSYGIPCDTLCAGNVIGWDQYIRLQVLSPPILHNKVQRRTNLNSRSLVLRLLYGKTALLFMGDAERDVERRLLDTIEPLNANAIKIGHHGSSTSSTLPFLRNVQPEYAIVSVGKKNRFNHPSPDIITRLQALPSGLLRTDQDGAVNIVSTGKSVFHRPWR